MVFECKVQFIFDITCPFCYLAHGRISNALRILRSRSHPVSLTLLFRPYLLNPSMSQEFPLLEYLQSRTGGAGLSTLTLDGRQRYMYLSLMSQYFSQDGMSPFNFSDCSVIGPSFECHRLVQYLQSGAAEGLIPSSGGTGSAGNGGKSIGAEQENEDEKQVDAHDADVSDSGASTSTGTSTAQCVPPLAVEAVVDTLYRSHYCSPSNPHGPGSDENLRNAMDAAGVPASVSGRFLEDKSLWERETRAALREQLLNGVDSVPRVVIEGRRWDVTLVGLRSLEDYVKALDTVIKEST